MEVKNRVLTLQNLLHQNNLDGYVVPSADPHQSEYVADAWKRREYISGFSGSAGLFATTQTVAGLWTDSRYFIQAEKELSGTGIQLFRQKEPGVPDWNDWLASQIANGGRLGIDLNLFSLEQYASIKHSMNAANIEIVPLAQNLIDQIWGPARPSQAFANIRIHPLEFAGIDRETKIAQVRTAMRDAGATSMIISALDEIAWLFNLRGADVSYNPVFYAFSLITEKQAIIFTQPSKVSTELKEQLKDSVILASYDAFPEYLQQIKKRELVWLDPSNTSAAVESQLTELGIPTISKKTPLADWKAIKNEAELAGMRAAHIRDAVAVLRFLAWFEEEVKNSTLNEISAAEKLHELRSEAKEYWGPSFATIAGYGPNGAQPHYRATADSYAEIKAEGIFLVDSGGQYIDGTTDITRTIACGTPCSWQKKIYTTVLKGHLQLARSLFPHGTNGYQLDVLARQPIWKEGLDYGHGTGHGVGAALCVHEGPFSVSNRKNMVALEVGHILSNEPGCYLSGEFGVRIENLVTVVEKTSSNNGRFLGFEDLTLCPYDSRLIDKSLLSPEETTQINQYHQLVFAKISPFLAGRDLDFLIRSTAVL